MSPKDTKDKSEAPVVGFYCPPPVDDELKESIPEEPKIDFWLAVKHPFDNYTTETLITDPEKIKAIIKDGRLPNCLKIKAA